MREQNIEASLIEGLDAMTEEMPCTYNDSILHHPVALSVAE